jgi:hypothetical protein
MAARRMSADGWNTTASADRGWSADFPICGCFPISRRSISYYLSIRLIEHLNISKMNNTTS